jgi:DNA mismatch endonuclease Vsr
MALSEPIPVSEARRRNMRAVRDRNTLPELKVRKLLHRLGYRFRLHQAHLPGRPDIVFPARRKVIEVRGCFWHQHADRACPKAGMPATRREWWQEKLSGNVRRDERNLAALRTAGWDVLVLWECELRDAPDLASRLTDHLGSPGKAAMQSLQRGGPSPDSCSPSSNRSGTE